MVVRRLSGRTRLAVMRMGSGPLLETFMIFAIGTVLVIRAVLASLGYPQLGGGGLHIAHMLWGGLILVAALVILVASIGWYSLAAGAVLGGIGFGFFIDEVGKFVTSDNNYFFRPAVSIMYVLFVLFFFIFQAIGRRLPSSHTYLVNALGATQETLIRGLTKDQKERARGMLAHADPAGPITATLLSLLDHMELVHAPPPGRLMRAARETRAAYDRVLRSRRFRLILVAIFVALTVVSGIGALLGVTFTDGLSIPEWAELLSNALVACLMVVGIVYLRRSRVAAYRWFIRGVLISLLVTQPFTFYREQFGALWGFGSGLLVWAVLRYMIELEEAPVASRVAEGDGDLGKHPPNDGRTTTR